MPESAVELAREVFGRASRLKDPSGRLVDVLDPATLDAVLDFFDPRIEFHEDPRFPEADIYKGRDATVRYFTAFMESFDEFTFEPEDFIGVGDDQVLIAIRIHSRGKGSGAKTEAEGGWIFTVRDGKAVRIDAYFDRNEAFEAAGLKSRDRTS
jgi:ketosteroid isomerase-like protein